MAMTLMEAAIEQRVDPLQMATIKMFTQVSPLLERIPFRKIDGNSLAYDLETALPGVAWRAVNQTYTDSTGTINPKIERLMILGGEVKIDNYIVNTQPTGAKDIKARQFAMKAQAISNAWDSAFLEGDDLVDPNQMVGLRRRLSGSQVIVQVANGGTLTLAALDNLIDLVPFPDKVLLMNRTLRRKVTALTNAVGGSVLIAFTQDTMGRQVTTYGGVPILVIEQTGDASTFLDFDEDPGDGVSDCSSVYCVSLGEGRVEGIYNNKGGKLVDVKDFGEQQAAPLIMGRCEGYYGMAMYHPRAAARLRSITNT